MRGDLLRPPHGTTPAAVVTNMNKMFRSFKSKKIYIHKKGRGGGVAQWLGRRISEQGVPGSNPGRCTFRCGLEQVTFTLLSTG